MFDGFLESTLYQAPSSGNLTTDDYRFGTEADHQIRYPNAEAERSVYQGSLRIGLAA